MNSFLSSWPSPFASNCLKAVLTSAALENETEQEEEEEDTLEAED